MTNEICDVHGSKLRSRQAPPQRQADEQHDKAGWASTLLNRLNAFNLEYPIDEPYRERSVNMVQT